MRFYQELAEYLGTDPWLTEQRCQYAPFELAWQWNQGGKNDPLKYYQESEFYMFDLSMYGALLESRGTFQWFRDMIHKHKWKTMLDFGGGIGSYTIKAASEGVHVVYTDVIGKTADYAKWRFKKYGVNPSSVELPRYDVVVAMDVFEHIPDPYPDIIRLAGKTEYILANPEEIQYNPIYPQHISRFDLTPWFTREDRYLWKRKQNP